MNDDAPAAARSGDEFDRQRFLRDLMGLLALPAFWSGTEPAFVLRTLFEAVESLMPLDVCYGVAAVGPGERLQILRVGNGPVSPTEPAWAPVLAFADVEPIAETTVSLDLPDRVLRCVRFPMGYVGEAGRIVLGSVHPQFPDATQVVTLRTALSLAAAGLETARVIRERDVAQRAKDEFLAVLGHELRNPLAPIVTALQLMTRKSGGNRSNEQEIIERQVQHLKRLVDDLLDVSRITGGGVELRKEVVDVADIVARALETVSPLIEKRRHDVRLSVARGLMIEADPTRITQVVANLLTNAAKYTMPAGRIDITAEAVEGWATIKVKDTGTGIGQDLLPHVFDLFVQGRQSKARSEGGLGIGLALVQRFVEAHGGTVAARSDGAGRGSEFVVRLPEAPAVAPGRAAPASDAIDGIRLSRAPVRVLVVDDNQDAAELAAAVLSAAGHHVEVAHTGLDALQCAGRVAFDVIVLDIGLPDLDGYAVARELHTRSPSSHCRLIALTGYGQPNDHAQSAQAGFAAHLVKPIEPARLLDAVQRVVAPDRAVEALPDIVKAERPALG